MLDPTPNLRCCRRPPGNLGSAMANSALDSLTGEARSAWQRAATE